MASRNIAYVVDENGVKATMRKCTMCITFKEEVADNFRPLVKGEVNKFRASCRECERNFNKDRYWNAEGVKERQNAIRKERYHNDEVYREDAKARSNVRNRRLRDEKLLSV